MDLKTVANTYDAFGGSLRLYLMPFTTLESDTYAEALQSIEPEYVWTHTQTHDVTHDEPPDWTAAAKAAREFKTEIQSAWRRDKLWAMPHYLYINIVSLIVAVEPVPDMPLPKAAAAFLAFWQGRANSPAENWPCFRQAVGKDAIQELRAAHAATRDESMNANPTGGNLTPDTEST